MNRPLDKGSKRDVRPVAPLSLRFVKANDASLRAHRGTGKFGHLLAYTRDQPRGLSAEIAVHAMLSVRVRRVRACRFQKTGDRTARAILRPLISDKY